MIEELAASTATAPDPMAETVAARQPDARFDAFVSDQIGEMAAELLMMPYYNEPET